MSLEILSNFVKERDIALQPTQQRLCLPIVNRIYKKMKRGIRFSSIKVDDDLIIDGHHRYIASLLAEAHLDKDPSSKTSATTRKDWENITIDTDDWDDEKDIQKFNEEDAFYNNISLKEIFNISE